MTTGHVYGVFFDHCSLLDDPAVVLSQCEVEYRRSRGVLDRDPQEVLQEMERVTLLLEDFLTRHHLAPQRTCYSKRTFLRDTLAARPDLASRTLETRR
jgi:hypothetical protein